VTPGEPDLAAVYAAAQAPKPSFAGRRLRAHGEPVLRRHFVSISLGGAAVAAVLALVVGLGAGFGPLGGRQDSQAVRPGSFLDYGLTEDTDPSADAALWLGREGAFDRAAAFRVDGEAGRIEAILVERPLEEDIGSFVAEVWKTTEL
jgi:hypothetical protein